MLVALLSDIHDHTTHLLLALHAAEEQGCTHMIYLGDMATIQTFHTLRNEWEHHIDLVLGNNEYEIYAFREAARLWPRTKLHDNEATITLDNRKLFFCHLPGPAMQAARTGKYDAVFFGHTHVPEISTKGYTLVANPGEVYGRQGKPSIGIYDTSDNTVKILPV